jgi:hypothetical protein
MGKRETRMMIFRLTSTKVLRHRISGRERAEEERDLDGKGSERRKEFAGFSQVGRISQVRGAVKEHNSENLRLLTHISTGIEKVLLDSGCDGCWDHQEDPIFYPTYPLPYQPTMTISELYRDSKETDSLGALQYDEKNFMMTEENIAS